MRKVLVIGGAGYIGSHTVRRLTQNGISVCVADDLSTGVREAVAPEVEFFKADVRRIDELRPVFAKHQFDAVIHFAAKLSVPESFKKHFEYFDINVSGTRNLLQLCEEFGIKKFIFSSTAAVYGTVSEGAVTEEHALNPQNPYGMTKQMAEMLIADQARIQPGFSFKILRYFNVAGAELDGSNGPRNFDSGQLVMNLCLAAGEGRPINVFGDRYPTKDGTAVRDYIHVLDLADAHLQAFHQLMEGATSGVWNCGYGKGFSVLEVIHAFEAANGVKFDVQVSAPRQGDPAEVIADNRKILRESNWRPQHNDIKTICKTSYDWVKNAVRQR